jgi:hypothetical protein
MFMVSMHLEDHDWRINDLGQWMKTDLRLAQLAHQPTEMEKNEDAAREHLSKIFACLLSYGTQYPRIGFPSRLALLTGRAGQEPSEEHAGFLGEPFTGEPLIIDGYRFSYTLTRPGSGPVYVTVRGSASADWSHSRMVTDMGAFQIVATPVEFGKSGIKSFFIDSTGKLTATSENRPATADDPALSENESGIVIED